MDTWTYERVRSLYTTMGEWSRNRAFYDFADVRTHRALRLARHLAAVARAIEGCGATGGRCTVERRRGIVAIHFEYRAIAARWTVYLSDQEYQLITREVLPACEPPRSFPPSVRHSC